jgi:hypothetical protein
MASLVRQPLADRQFGRRHGFRFRGESVSRLESFSDAVFGFALTLLVVSLEVPHTFTELLNAMRGFVGFSFCFFMLALVWYRHYVYYRRYGLEDAGAIVLNFFLLFVVLFYIYPLKFMFTLLPAMMGAGGGARAAVEPSQVRLMFTVYSGGFAAVFGLFGLMYWRAWRLRDQLALNAVERIDTCESVFSSFILMGIGLLSIVIAMTAPKNMVGMAGMVYFAIGICETAVGSYFGRKRKRAELEEDAMEVTSAPGHPEPIESEVTA